MDYSINMLLNTVPSANIEEEKRPSLQKDEYQMAKVEYNYANNSYAFELIDWPEEKR